jgi:hypothetical protein
MFLIEHTIQTETLQQAVLDSPYSKAEQVVVFSLLILRCASGAHLNPRDPPTENLPSQ